MQVYESNYAYKNGIIYNELRIFGATFFLFSVLWVSYGKCIENFPLFFQINQFYFKLFFIPIKYHLIKKIFKKQVCKELYKDHCLFLALAFIFQHDSCLVKNVCLFYLVCQKSLFYITLILTSFIFFNYYHINMFKQIIII